MDAPISYAIVIGFFIGLVVILFSARAKRVADKKKETPKGSAEEVKHSPS